MADRRSFGADRSELLERLARRSHACFIEGSYLLTRPGRQTRYMGPSVCDAPEAARALMARALQGEDSQGWTWDLLPKNVAAAAIARDLGFTPTRHLHRMVRGKELRAKEEIIYAIAGFELG